MPLFKAIRPVGGVRADEPQLAHALIRPWTARHQLAKWEYVTQPIGHTEVAQFVEYGRFASHCRLPEVEAPFGDAMLQHVGKGALLHNRPIEVGVLKLEMCRGAGRAI